MTPCCQKAFVGDLCEITSSKRIFAADYQAEGVPFYRGKEITERYKGNLNVSTELFISREKFEEIKSRFGVPEPGDLLLTSVGTLGSPYVVKHDDEFYFKDGNLTWFRKFKNLDSRFLYYWLLSPRGKAELQKCTIGSSQSAFTIVLLKQMEIGLPPLPVQRRIAGILSAYDDLIENNQRRIKILEEMARSLYRESFVNFRFPGHEKVPLVDSPLGPIPKGWVVGRLDDVLVLQRGFDLPKTDRVEGTVPILAATGVTGFHVEAKVKAPGIVTGRSGTIGDVLYVQEDFWPLNTVLWVKDFPQAEPLYAYYVLSSLDLKQFNSGAAVPTLNRNDIHGFDTLIPPRTLQKRFQEIAGAMHAQTRILELQIQNLRRTRDLLLPRLLSGQVELPGTEAAA
jgi:type I restriction enzyme, S subunit